MQPISECHINATFLCSSIVIYTHVNLFSTQQQCNNNTTHQSHANQPTSNTERKRRLPFSHSSHTILLSQGSRSISHISPYITQHPLPSSDLFSSSSSFPLITPPPSSSLSFFLPFQHVKVHQEHTCSGHSGSGLLGRLDHRQGCRC